MKALSWTLLLALLVFGIGWTARLLAERGQQFPDSSPTVQQPEHSHHGAWNGSRSGGPFISTVRQFAEELHLDGDQRQRLDALLAETVADISLHEHSIRDLIRATRPKVMAILTEQQSEQLEEKMRARRQEYTAARRARDLAWFREHGHLSTEKLAAVESVLSRYDAEKTRFFESFPARDSWPDDQQLRAAIDGFKKQRNRGLSEVLDPQTLKQFCNRSSSRGSRR